MIDLYDKSIGWLANWLITNFPANHDRSRREVVIGVLSEPIVHGDDMEDVEQLSFVFMDSLHLIKLENNYQATYRSINE